MKEKARDIKSNHRKNQGFFDNSSSDKNKSKDGQDIFGEDSKRSTMKKTIARLKLKALEEATHGLYVPLTPRSVEKKWKTKERIRKITAMLKVSPRVFERGSGTIKAWQVRPIARQSHVVKAIKEHLLDKRTKMKPFSSKKIFHQILQVSGPEEKGEECDPIKASIAGKFEYMARELIDKTAYLQGVPYACLGVPALNRPKTAPLPQLDSLREDSFAVYPFDFFRVPLIIGSTLESRGLQATAAGGKQRAVAQHITRREAILKVGRTASTISRLLMKMGLLHLHDMDFAKFPKDQIQLTNILRKKAEKGGFWMEDMDAGMLNVAPRALSVIPYTGRTIVGPAGNIERFGDTESSSNKSTGSEDSTPSRPTKKGFEQYEHFGVDHEKATTFPDENSWLKRPGEHLHSQESLMMHRSENKEILKEPQVAPLEQEPDWNKYDAFVFNMKKKYLLQRKTLIYDLSWELTAMSDRRTYWRHLSPFAAEVCRRIEALMFATKGRRTPNTRYLWKIAEKHHPIERKEDAPVFESEVQSIYRFYERVCRFIDHQKMADPLMDILLYFLKEIFQEEKLTLQPELLLRLCERLASIPENVANSGRMASTMPILQFIAKELHIPSSEFDEYISRSNINRLQSDGYKSQD